MDSRIADRRRGVREEAARRRLRWTIGVLVMAGIVGAVVWLVQSPLLAMDEITVSGANRTAIDEALATAGVTQGMPLISVRAGNVVTALEADPWVETAVVRVVWPDALEIAIVERVPRLWVKGAGSAWMLVSDRGFVVARSESGGTALPHLELPDLADVVPGQQLDSNAVLGAIEFVGAVMWDVSLDGSAESLFAWVEGYRVRLGRPVDMSAKAASLTALLEEGVVPGSTIDLLSPVRPAVVPPVVEPTDTTDTQVEVEGEG